MAQKTTLEVEIPENPLERIIGQEEAVKASGVIAKQRRNLLLIGPPGTGKSMVAQAISYLLPKPQEEVSVLHNPETPEKPVVEVRGRTKLQASRFTEKSVGRVVSPLE
ncbi:MAG: ATP-binding protein, partial [Candidatus Micrarchaeota archaeon]